MFPTRVVLELFAKKTMLHSSVNDILLVDRKRLNLPYHRELSRARRLGHDAQTRRWIYQQRTDHRCRRATLILATTFAKDVSQLRYFSLDGLTAPPRRFFRPPSCCIVRHPRHPFRTIPHRLHTHRVCHLCRR